jgi:DMSO reductase anchor subunit
LIRALLASGKSEISSERIANMLYTIAVVLIILWLLGLVTSTTMGGLIHVLLVIAIVVVLLRVISGRKPL